MARRVIPIGLLVLAAWPPPALAQPTAPYHLHQEASQWTRVQEKAAGKIS